MEIETDIYKSIGSIFIEMKEDPFHRYKSWEHCYKHFQDQHSNPSKTDLDLGSLQLAFYLASWGMYRGSSMLLQKDYKLHTSIVNELLDNNYDVLWILDFNILSSDLAEVNLILELCSHLRKIYWDLQISPTDTLITKIILGTICCLPAYDSLFKNGISYWNSSIRQETAPISGNFGKNSILGLINFYKENQSEFDQLNQIGSENNIHYPIMKLIDMYFWNIGFQIGE